MYIKDDFDKTLDIFRKILSFLYRKSMCLEAVHKIYMYIYRCTLQIKS